MWFFLLLSIFCQALKEGFQDEQPDIWLTNGNPWEIARPNIKYNIGFYGKVDNHKWSPAEQVHRPCQLAGIHDVMDSQSSQYPLRPMLGSSYKAGVADVALQHAGFSWHPPCMQVVAQAYDNPIPGYKTSTVGNLRLWEAKPLHEFALDKFNEGKYDEVSSRPYGWSMPDSTVHAWPMAGMRRHTMTGCTDPYGSKIA